MKHSVYLNIDNNDKMMVTVMLKYLRISEMKIRGELNFVR